MRFETELHLPRRLFPLKVLAQAWDMTPIAAILELEGLGPNDEIPDLLFEVEHGAGYYHPGDGWNHPPEGEDPEITAIRLAGTDYDLLKVFPFAKVREIHDALIYEAWESQRDHEHDRELEAAEWAAELQYEQDCYGDWV